MPSTKALAAAKAKGQEDDRASISTASLKILRETASDVVVKISEKSNLFDKTKDEGLSRFGIKELSLGRVLGRGGFCVVSEVQGINLGSAYNETISQKRSPSIIQKEYHTREAMAQRCIRDGDARYAIKKMSTECRSSPGLFLKGTIDLAVEARFLAVMAHPHLIKMRAVASVDPFHEDYFIVLDRLYDTLETKARKWKSKEKKGKGIRGSLLGGKKKLEEVKSEKIISAHDISSAMQYMHSLNIIYRDLKPENIGFDVRGEVKIFDLGLAKELNKLDKENDGTYKMTGFTGSLRYMAPEVAKSLSYNLSADVYSFGMLFWHIMENESPFNSYSCKMHEDLVVNKGYRPVCHKSWPKEWSDLIKKAWSLNHKKRPSFDEIVHDLSREVDKLITEEITDDLDISIRSFKGITK